MKRREKWFAIVLGLVLGYSLILGYVGWVGVKSESELPGWLHSRAHDILGTTAGAQTNYTIMFNVYYGSGTNFESDAYLDGECRTDFGDVRFTDSDGNEFDYWMQSRIDGVQAIFWVEIDYIPQSPDYTTIYLHYGNPNATTTGNGFNTFLVFDDFEDGTWTDRWEPRVNNGIITESNGILTLETEDGSRYNEIMLRSRSNFTGQTVELMSLMEHTQHWNRGNYFKVLIMKGLEDFLGAAPVDTDENQIRAEEKYPFPSKIMLLLLISSPPPSDVIVYVILSSVVTK